MLPLTTCGLSLGEPGFPTEELQKAAHRIDELVAQSLFQTGHQAPGYVNDGTFLRRAYLVTVGRIPNLAETRKFLEDDSVDKRRALVLRLTESEGYRSHLTNYYYNLFRVSEVFRGGRHKSAAPYHQYLRKAVEENKKWDELTRELVSAQGSGWAKGNGAVGYYATDKGMPLDNLAMTMRIFTGERLECAQCHDSPRNGWDRIDFFELAAFTHGQESMNRKALRPLHKKLRKEGEDQREFLHFTRWIEQQFHHNSIAGGGRGRIRLPKDYQYADGEPNEMIRGRTHFGQRIRGSEKKNAGDSRKTFAEWMTNEKNDRFRYIIVNRMWERVMGRPLSSPVDHFVKLERTVSPDLVEMLCELMGTLDFDLKAFQQVLLMTRTFQFQIVVSETETAEEEGSLAGRPLGRMSAEQVWDSVVTLAVGEMENLPRRQFSDGVFYQGRRVFPEMTMTSLAAKVLSTTDPKKYEKLLRDLYAEIEKKGVQAMSMMAMKGGKKAGAKPLGGAVRASELRAPAPRHHLLRKFGQSDRKLIDSESRDANLAQVFSVLNGKVQEMVVSKDRAAVYAAVSDGRSVEENITSVYLAVLTRYPTQDELAWLTAEVIDGTPKSYRNLVAALLMTHEFLFIP